MIHRLRKKINAPCGRVVKGRKIIESQKPLCSDGTKCGNTASYAVNLENDKEILVCWVHKREK